MPDNGYGSPDHIGKNQQDSLGYDCSSLSVQALPEGLSFVFRAGNNSPLNFGEHLIQFLHLFWMYCLVCSLIRVNEPWLRTSDAVLELLLVLLI